MTVSFFLIIFSGALLHADNSSPSYPAIEKFIQSVIERKDSGATLVPKSYSSTVEAKLFNVNELTGETFEDGMAYGVVVDEKIKIPYSNVRELLSSQGGIFKIISKVKTLRNVEKISEGKDAAHLKIVIKPPVIDPLHTDIDLHFQEISETEGTLQWHQLLWSGDLSYNQGVLVAEGIGDETHLLMVAIHVMKPERKFTWFTRSPAKSFSKTHYGNFLRSLNALLGVPDPEAQSEAFRRN